MALMLQTWSPQTLGFQSDHNARAKSNFNVNWQFAPGTCSILTNQSTHCPNDFTNTAAKGKLHGKAWLRRRLLQSASKAPAAASTPPAAATGAPAPAKKTCPTRTPQTPFEECEEVLCEHARGWG